MSMEARHSKRSLSILQGEMNWLYYIMIAKEHDHALGSKRAELLSYNRILTLGCKKQHKCGKFTHTD